MVADQSVVVVGSANVDLIVTTHRRPAPGETVLGDAFRVLPGGKGANQALAAALVAARRPTPDVRVAMIGAVGDDANAAIALRELRTGGVDVGGVAACAGATTGIAAITVGDDADNSIIVVPGANSHVIGDFVRARAAVVRQAAVVVVQMEVPLTGVEAAATLCTGRLIVNLAPAVAVPAALVRQADPLVVNEHEAMAALAIVRGDPVGPDDLAADEEAAAVAELVAAGVRSVVITLGARGCIIGQAGAAAIRLPARVVTPVDTTGAGDAFVGALAAGLAAGDSLAAACATATAVAAYSTQGVGAQASYPRPTDVIDVLPSAFAERA